MRILSSIFCLLLIAAPCWLQAQEQSVLQLFPSPSQAEADTEQLWNRELLFTLPEVYDAASTGFTARDGIAPVFYDGLPSGDRPTRVFAWVGIPDVPEGQKVPGIVLVHGGGGTAFRDWVKLWMDRGYAVIAMDTTGTLPVAEEGMNVKAKKHQYAPATQRNFAGADAPLESQWLYHGVGAVVRAHTLLRSLPQVDAEKTGITGISWGGIITEIAVGTDPRFKFAAPVYGCGFLGENSFWLREDFQKVPPETIRKWISLWDPSQHLFRADLPILFVNGTNDRHFRPDSWQKTYRLPTGPVTLSLQVGLGHSHPAGDVKEITVFADSIVKGGKPLPAVTAQGEDGGIAWVEFSETTPAKNVRFVHTKDDGDWPKRRWRQDNASVSGNRGSFAIPEGATAWYFNLIDERGCIVSSEHHSSSPTE